MFKDAFAAAGLPYFNPHSFRKTLALLGGQRCRTPEEYKVWSQNLGHEHVLTTFCSYGGVSSYRQTEIMRSFADPTVQPHSLGSGPNGSNLAGKGTRLIVVPMKTEQ